MYLHAWQSAGVCVCYTSYSLEPTRELKVLTRLRLSTIFIPDIQLELFVYVIKMQKYYVDRTEMLSASRWILLCVFLIHAIRIQSISPK